MRLVALLALVALASPAQSQQTKSQQAGLPRLTSEQMVERMKTRLNLASPSQPCGRSLRMDEIIVCGLGKDAYRFKTVEPVEIQAVKALRIHAPGQHGGVGVSVSATVCFLQKCPKPVTLIDVKSLPQAAAGSDAEKIARGEMSDH
jgi:hypothetical protein